MLSFQKCTWNAPRQERRTKATTKTSQRHKVPAQYERRGRGVRLMLLQHITFCFFFFFFWVSGTKILTFAFTGFLKEIVVYLNLKETKKKTLLALAKVALSSVLPFLTRYSSFIFFFLLFPLYFSIFFLILVVSPSICFLSFLSFLLILFYNVWIYFFSFSFVFFLFSFLLLLLSLFSMIHLISNFFTN